MEQKKNSRYITVCELVYGGIPIDKDWATSTIVYKKKYAELYPKKFIKKSKS